MTGSLSDFRPRLSLKPMAFGKDSIQGQCLQGSGRDDDTAQRTGNGGCGQSQWNQRGQMAMDSM